MPAGAIPFPFGVCRICNDKATGVHYGVATCEGCKGFFKRSITRGDKYKCFFGGECDLTPKNRNRCKSCRFKRCLDTGMAVEAVRMGRIPKVEKEKALEVFHQEGADFNKLELRLEQTGAGNYDFQLNPKNEDRNRDTEVNPAEHKDKANQDAAYHHDDGFQEFKQEKTAFQHETYGNHKADYNGQNKMSVPQSFERKNSSNVSTEMSTFFHNSFTTDTPVSHVPLKKETVDSHLIESIPQFQRNTGLGHKVLYKDETFTDKFSQAMLNDKVNEKIDRRSLNAIDQGPFESRNYGPHANASNLDINNRERHSLNQSEFAQSWDESNQERTNQTRFEHVGERRVPHTLPHTQTPAPLVVPEVPVTVHPNFIHYNTSTQHQYFESQSQNNNKHTESAVDLTRKNNHFDSQQDLNSFQGHFPGMNTGSFAVTSVPTSHALYTETLDTQSRNLPNTVADPFLSPMRLAISHSNVSPTKNSRNVWQAKSPCVFTPPSSKMPFQREMLHSPQRENASPFYWPSETTPSVGGRSSPAPSTFSKDSNGSGSSKSNPYSPLLIKLLMEQVLETNNGGNVIEKLKEKLSLSKLDSVTAGRVIGLLKEATGHLVAKSDRTTSSQNTSHTGSTDLSDSKQERIALFLDDVKSNLPIDKSKRCSHKRKWSDNEMLVSLRDLDMERSVKMHLDGSSGPQPNTPLSHTHSHNTSVTHSSVSLSGQARLVLPTLSYGNPEVLDNSMSSIEETQVGNLDHERFKNLKDGLNLGVKILFRLKPEHREKLRLYREGKLFLRVLTDSEEDVQLIYEKLINGIPDLSQRILGFCESVPGFTSFPKSDQDKLMKRAYYDMWTLSYAEYFHNGNSYWILPTGEIYSAPAMRKILNDEIVDIIMTFADKFNVLKLTDLEVVILSAVILTKTVGLELEETEAVNTLNSELLELFSLEVRKNHSDHTGLILDVFSLTPLMDEINRIQKEIIGKFSTSGINKKVEGAVKDGRITNGSIDCFSFWNVGCNI
ncbi:uncharacterized protein LOC128232450 isoform X2 [Mya arenaria]|uniref:uncharacterized protein LOC128232450 isoform X2 n=1 Tax=Mya arenaria TaxID=6604 RepID=UPI0022E143B2|nr:uncharacterized protein LOC128232450 isoform X2 [Mya arenaria]